MNLNILIVLLKEINWNWLKKGIYLYEYMDNFKKFKKKKNLPGKKCFFNSLKNCTISNEECQRASDIWNVFNIKNLGEHHDL